MNIFHLKPRKYSLNLKMRGKFIVAAEYTEEGA